MADITFTISVPTDKKTAIINDFVAYHGYVETISSGEVEIPNPETKADFARKTVREFIKNSVKSYRATAGAETARLASIAEVDAIEFI